MSAVSVHEGTQAPGRSRAMHPATDAPKFLLRDDAAPTADLFASLAERGAALVDRQHEVLEALQHREEDPERLAGLFRLDHLAAQLRRNSNAALVLAGLPTVRSIRAPKVLSELASAAVSEVNGYQRVTVGAFPTRRVQAHVASDLVHLLGDLLENALAVSPRSGGVWVRGERPTSAETSSPTLVRVGDSGVGVSDAALQRLNDILAGRASQVGTGPGVGLVVTRDIAQRHGLTVRFRRLVSGGLVATVALPDALFEPTGAGRPTRQADDPTTSMQAN
jgi:signal transduction histidine kinase